MRCKSLPTFKNTHSQNVQATSSSGKLLYCNILLVRIVENSNCMMLTTSEKYDNIVIIIYYNNNNNNNILLVRVVAFNL